MLMLTPTRYFAGIMVVLLLLAACGPTPAAPPTDESVQRISGGGGSHTVLARQAAPTATATNQITPSPPQGDTRPDVTVWWPAALMPAPDSAARESLLMQFDGFRSTADRSLLVRTKRLDGPGGIISTLRTGSPVAPTAMPDLVLLPREHLIIAADTGLIFPLDDIMPATTLRDLYPQASALGNLNGVQYGVAYALNVQHFVYRDTVFEVAPTSFDTLLAAGQRFAFPAGVETGVNDVFLAQYLAAGGRVLEDDGQPVLDEVPLLDVLTFYEQAVASGLIGPDALAYRTPQDYWDTFLSGTLSLAQIDSTTYLTTLGQIASAAVIPIPTENEQTMTPLSGWLWAITTADPDRQADAIDFLDWVMRAENQAAFTEVYGILPSQQTALRLWDNADYNTLVERMLSTDEPILPHEINMTTANALQAAFTAVVNGEKTAAEATADALASVG